MSKFIKFLPWFAATAIAWSIGYVYNVRYGGELSWLRMMYELYLQLQGRAGERQLGNPRLGLTHNLGGIPNRNVASVSVIGPLD